MLNLPRWQDCTQAQHVRAGMYAYYRDEYRAAQGRWIGAMDRWHAEASGADDEREYYGIDTYAQRMHAAQASAIGFASAW